MTENYSPKNNSNPTKNNPSESSVENQANIDLDALASTKSEEKVSIASNGQLIWWRFRKNKMAVISLFILVIVLLSFYSLIFRKSKF